MSFNQERLPMTWPLTQEERPENDWQLYAEAITSYRAWTVCLIDDAFIMRSITKDTFWKPREEFVSRCIPPVNAIRPVVPHQAPNIAHGCGIYSVKDKEDAIKWSEYRSPNNTVVYGKASIWGEVFEFTKGYLSEFAYPSKIFVPKNIGELANVLSRDELSYELTRTYQVEAVNVE